MTEQAPTPEERASSVIWIQAIGYSLVKDELIDVERFRQDLVPDKIESEELFVAGMKILESKGYIEYRSTEFYLTELGVKNFE